MNPVHIHLLLNHVSILAAIFSFLILSAGLIMSERVLIRTAMIGFVLSALVSIPVFLTGEPAEEAVEDVPGVSESLIESHEEAAEVSIWLIEALGLISLIGIFIGEKHQRTLQILIVVVALFAVSSLAYTGLEGGKIRHSEIRGDATDAGLMLQEDDEKEEHH